MTTATYHLPTAIPEAPAAPRKSFFRRFYDALMEARMRQAMRELSMHRHLLPQDTVKNAGYKATLSSADALPFVR